MIFQEVHVQCIALVSVHIQGLHVSNVCKIMYHIPEYKSTHICIHAYIPVHAHACSCQGVYVHESTIQNAITQDTARGTPSVSNN